MWVVRRPRQGQEVAQDGGRHLGSPCWAMCYAMCFKQLLTFLAFTELVKTGYSCSVIDNNYFKIRCFKHQSLPRFLGQETEPDLQMEPTRLFDLHHYQCSWHGKSTQHRHGWLGSVSLAMVIHAKIKKKKAIKHGRPPLTKPQSAILSSRATRSIIRSHHTLEKELAKSYEEGDTARTADLKKIIAAKGGLQSYQLASTLGQSSERGGDSSRVLVDWLKEATDDATKHNQQLRLLEVGALSTRNACSRVTCLDITRIDLHSQQPGIREIDFMDLPPPAVEDPKYNIISLSLVLNFVPDAAARGAMLARLPEFLSRQERDSTPLLSCCFLVLPLSCISNSRYLTEEKLGRIMHSLGFVPTRVKKTTALYYSLWKFDTSRSVMKASFKKEELRSGGSRNNFAIVLR